MGDVVSAKTVPVGTLVCHRPAAWYEPVVWLRVEEVDLSSDCSGCYFDSDSGCTLARSSFGSCSAVSRSDCRSVIFKRVHFFVP